MANSMKVSFLGVELGQASGWDGELGQCWWVNDFKPGVGVDLPSCDALQFDEDKGFITAQDFEGNEIGTWKINWFMSIA